MLKEKEHTIQLMKKNLNIPTNQLIQASELSEMEKEKERLNGKLTYFQA